MAYSECLAEDKYLTALVVACYVLTEYIADGLDRSAKPMQTLRNTGNLCI